MTTSVASISKNMTFSKVIDDIVLFSISTEDLRAKHLTKLAKQAANSSQLG